MSQIIRKLVVRNQEEVEAATSYYHRHGYQIRTFESWDHYLNLYKEMVVMICGDDDRSVSYCYHECSTCNRHDLGCVRVTAHPVALILREQKLKRILK